MKNQIVLLLFFTTLVSTYLPAQSNNSQSKTKSTPSIKDSTSVTVQPLITFIELGSVNCIPCKAMQPVMKSVEEKYGSQIKIIFYDVWKKEQAHYAQSYKIRLIPTQVFLDSQGKELMRHEGFLPEKDIDTFLQSKGLKPKSQKKD